MFAPCALPAGDEKYCLSEAGFQQLVHWLIDRESNAKDAVAAVEEDRDVWKVRANAAESNKTASQLGLALGITAGVAAALALGFGVGYGTARLQPR